MASSTEGKCPKHHIPLRMTGEEAWCAECERKFEDWRVMRQFFQAILSYTFGLATLLAFISMPMSSVGSSSGISNIRFWGPIVVVTVGLALSLSTIVIRLLFRLIFRAPDQRLLPWYARSVDMVNSFTWLTLCVAILYGAISSGCHQLFQITHGQVGSRYFHLMYADVSWPFWWTTRAFILVFGVPSCLSILSKLGWIQRTALLPDVGDTREHMSYHGSHPRYPANIVRVTLWAYGALSCVLFFCIQSVFMHVHPGYWPQAVQIALLLLIICCPIMIALTFWGYWAKKAQVKIRARYKSTVSA